jgi:hypothetical protein
MSFPLASRFTIRTAVPRAHDGSPSVVTHSFVFNCSDTNGKYASSGSRSNRSSVSRWRQSKSLLLIDAAPAADAAVRSASIGITSESEHFQMERGSLGRPPVIRLLFIIQMPHAEYMRSVAVAFRPVDRFPLRFKGAERMVRVGGST